MTDKPVLMLLLLVLTGCKALGTNVGRAVGKLGEPVPGHDGCYYRTDGTGVSCKTTARQQKYDRAQLVESWTKKWQMAEQIVLERDPHYSLLQPEIRSLSDGTEMWTYREGGDCSMEETTGSRVARGLHAYSASQPQQVDCNTTVYGNRASTNCVGPSNPGPPPAVRVERVCKNPDRVSQFFLRDGRVVEARLTLGD